MDSDSTVLTLVGSSVYHLGAKTEKSCNFAEWALFALSDGVNNQPVDVEERCSCWGLWSDQCLEVDGCSSVDVLEGQHQCLESDAGRNRKSVEVTEEGGHMGEFGKIVNEARCSVLDMLQQLSQRGWESSQEGVAVVQTGDDQSLGQNLRHIFC